MRALGAEAGVRFLTLGFEPSAVSHDSLLVPDARAPVMRAIPEWTVAGDTETAREHIFSTACIQASSCQTAHTSVFWRLIHAPWSILWSVHSMSLSR